MSVEVITITLTDAMGNRNIVGRICRDGFGGRVRTIVGIRANQRVSAGIGNRDSGIATAVAPCVIACTISRQNNAVTLTETVVTADTDIR